MTEPEIAPLARRLAEENNVDWRRLVGSGEGGRVVERDVLGFLARVMAGEEDLDPTPEPVPDGMQAWPEADVAAFRAGPAAPAPPVERSVTSTLDDDLFLFDDAAAPPSPSAAPPVFAAESAAAQDPVEDDDGILLVDEPGAGPAAGAVDAAPAAVDVGAEAVVFDTDGLGFDAAPAAATADAGLPDLFEDGAADVGVAGDGVFLADDGLSVADDDHSAADDGLFVADALSGADEAPAPGAATFAADDELFVDEAADAATGDADAAGPVLDLDAGWPTPDRAPEPSPLAVPASVTDAAPLTAAVGTEDAGAEGGPAPAVAVGDLAAADVRLVRHGQLWRRRVDDRAFRSAVSHVADALGAAPNAVAVALLARAAARAWSGAVVVDAWWWDGADALRRAVATGGSFAASLDGLAEHTDAAEGPAVDLVVADLATLGVDEAVLHLDAPVLALGRAGSDGAWLTLSGDDVPREAVAALGRVAEALGAPVRLLV